MSDYILVVLISACGLRAIPWTAVAPDCEQKPYSFCMSSLHLRHRTIVTN